MKKIKDQLNRITMTDGTTKDIRLDSWDIGADLFMVYHDDDMVFALNKEKFYSIEVIEPEDAKPVEVTGFSDKEQKFL